MPLLSDPNVIRGMAGSDDAGVYRLSEDIAIIQTVDFFTPIVDDPYMFGQIAAANSLSDVYAMGGKPLTAMNIVCFPIDTMDITVLKDILKGGVDKMAEAGVVLLGGHSINDAELKYGLSVTGTVHPERMVTNEGAVPGDKLILTKKLGTGILGSALKSGVLNSQTEATMVKSMAALNNTASRLMQEEGIHACTDVTGFGFLGHLSQMLKNSRVGAVVNSSAVPVFNKVVECLEKGLQPGGLQRNRDYYSPAVKIESGVPEYIMDVLFDPQTSGGLLISLAAEQAEGLLEKLGRAGIAEAVIVGEIVAGPEGVVTVK